MHLRLVILLSTLLVVAFGGQGGSKPSTGTTKSAKIQLTVDDLKLAVYQRSETPSHTSIKVNTKDSKRYEVDNKVRVQLKFEIKDAATKQAVIVQQAFVAFVNSKLDKEVVFVAEPEANTKTYVADLDMKTQEKNFDNINGTYNARLIIGDSNAANAIDWNFADVEVKISPSTPVLSKKSQIVNYEPLPEIKHEFREPEKLPPQIISDVFTILCLAPLGLLFIMWITIGLNFNNAQYSLWSLGFHGGLGAIFVLYFTFWIQLNMFDTLKYLALVGVPTFIFGNRLLRSLNEYRRNLKPE